MTGFAAAAARSTPAPPPPKPKYVPGEVIVRFKADVGPARRTQVLGAEGARRKRGLRLPGAEVVSVADGQSVEATARELEARPDVLFAEPNYVYRATATPDDPRFGALWGLHQTADHDIDAPEAWDEQTGSAAVKVAVVDTGVAYDHPDLAANMLPGYDFFDGDNDPRDEHGHGTHVAGTIGAVGNNVTGVTGVSWEVSLIPVRVLGPNGGGTTETVTNGFLYAAQQGAKVVNASLGGSGESQAMQAAIDAAADTTLFVVAAGNGESDNDASPTYPCSYPSPNLVCVAATDEADRLAEFSNYGDTSVDLAAPGVGIESTWLGYTTVFTETFETDLSGRWTGGGTPNTWGRTSAKAADGSFSVTDSPAGNYRNLADNWLRLAAPIDLTGRKGCSAAYAMSLAIEDDMDLVSLEVSNDGSRWAGVDWFSLDSPGGGFEQLETPLPELSGTTGYLRFRLESDRSVTADGVYIDDLRVRCIGTTYSSDDYRRLDGTSMATPHTAGAAALVWAENPGGSVSSVRSALLTTVDRVPALAGAVASGGRLNAAAAVRSVSAAPPAPPPAPPAPPPAPPAPPPSPPPSPTPPPPTSPPPPAPPAAGPPPPAPPPPSPPPVRAQHQAVCVVPSVKGRTVAQARRALVRSRCMLGRVGRTYSLRMRAGRIVNQNRRPGARLPRGARVSVAVSRGRRRR